MNSICVFCGSSHGNKPEYTAAAQRLGLLLAQQNITLVYGGGNIGLMGEIADAALAGGGNVIGVIPQALVTRELAHTGLTELRIVNTMHQRKQLMSDLSDAYIALPGGLGTLEEMFETLTWAQLGIHAKACGLLNTAGYYDHLRTFLEQAADEKFIQPEHLNLILVENDESALLKKLQSHRVPRFEQWIDESKT